MATPPLRKKSNFLENLKKQKWLTLIALPILIFAMLREIYWIWGLMFVYWGIHSIKDQQVYLVETIKADEDPVLYWLIITLWIGSGLIYVQASFFPTFWS